MTNNSNLSKHPEFTRQNFTMFLSTFIPLVLTTSFLPITALASPPTSPKNNIFVRQASECADRTGGIACPGGVYCCPASPWECKAGDPYLCTASIGLGQVLTATALDWASLQASVSRDVDSIRSRISGIAASITGPRSSVSPGRVTATSSAVQSSAAASQGESASSASQPADASSVATPSTQSTPSVASATAATASATGGAVVPTLRKDLMMGGLIGIGLFLA